ncbi:hypothetical protein H4R35_005659 [Dimargaris xerosporica]|nr:hypothetical protein H4R35_005659 [Dimargaris xerosporica]
MKLTTVTCIALIAAACVLLGPAQAVKPTIPVRSDLFSTLRNKFSSKSKEPQPPATGRKTNYGKQTKADEKFDQDLVAYSKQVGGDRYKQDSFDSKITASKQGK